MKHIGRYLLIALFALAFSSCEWFRKSPPNVLFIMIDDLGYKDTGVYGSNYYETPNIDQLASQGMLFTQAYASAANCAPSRATFMSGLYHPWHGIYTVASSERGAAKDRKIIPTPNTETLADSLFTLAEFFREQDYRTAHFGKWHLGEDPRTQGFDVNVAGSHRGNPGRDGYFSPYNVEPLEDGPAGEYLTDRLTDEAIRFLQAKQDSSFFLYMPYYTVHTPLQGKEALIRKYREKGGDSLQNNAVYAAMVEAMDQNIGRLLSSLDSLGLAENTLVVFTSDNGGIRAVSSQEPLRAGKGSYYEGGIRVPLIVRWPGQVAAGTQSAVPVSNLDFFPTFQEIMTAADADEALDGQSLLPILKQEGDFTERPLFWHFPIYLQAYDTLQDDGRDPLFRTRPGSVVRQGKWKLHEYFEDGGLELYNLEEDIGERNNLAEEMPEKTQEMYRILEEWRESTQAPVPIEPNPAYMGVE
jgi:arylsulfatase A-like enzyme